MMHILTILIALAVGKRDQLIQHLYINKHDVYFFNAIDVQRPRNNAY